MWVVTEKKSMMRFPMKFFDDILTSTSSIHVLSDMLQVMLLVLMMLVVCSWLNVDRGVTYFFIWDLSGGWSSLCCQIT